VSVKTEEDHLRKVKSAAYEEIIPSYTAIKNDYLFKSD